MVEMNTIRQISGQVAVKFGLSQERSMQVAKLSAHWNKLGSSRALTEKDVDQFSTKLLGASVLDLEKAIKQSQLGNISKLEEFVAKAAEVNDTTPEQISGIVAHIFF